MGKRILLFVLTNILVVLMVSIILSMIGIDQYGASYIGLAIICLVWGSVGSFISLRMSKWMAKRMMGLQPVNPYGQHAYIVDRVRAFAQRERIAMPEVYVYPSDELNAFATGPSRNNSLVAVSEGLLRHMRRDEVEGVLAHEVAHIANGDMVTMALVQGIVNAFVMFLARVVAIAIDNMVSNDDDGGGGLGYLGYIVVVNVLQVVFGLLTAPVVAGFSRFREYRADEGGARLAGKDKMIAALEALRENFSVDQLDQSQPSLKAMKISGGGLVKLLSTHPPLEDRIRALKKGS
jgi:heat shock protein HtpX